MNTLCSSCWKEQNFNKNWKFKAGERGGKLTETMKAHHLIMCNLADKKQRGYKLGLIIGRNPNEYIPKKIGWIWATLDVKPSSEEYAMKCAMKEEDKEIQYYDGGLSTRGEGDDCYHFNIDITTNEFMGYTGGGEWRSFINKAIMMLKGFDTVVIDWSTLKFFSTNTRPRDFKVWEALKDLLNKNNESKLIVELVPFSTLQNTRIEKHRDSSLHVESNLIYGRMFDEATIVKRMGEEKTQKKIDEKKNDTIVFHDAGEPIFIVLQKDYENRTIEYLLTLFNTVEVKEKGIVYPTREGMEEKRRLADSKFVICTGPKNTLNLQERLNTLTDWRKEKEEREKRAMKQEKERKEKEKEREKERERNKTACLKKREKCTYDFFGWGNRNYVLKDGECSNQCPICVNNICEEGSFKDWLRSQTARKERGDLDCPWRAPVYCSWTDGSECITQYDKCSNYSSKKHYNDRNVLRRYKPKTKSFYPPML